MLTIVTFIRNVALFSTMAFTAVSHIFIPTPEQVLSISTSSVDFSIPTPTPLPTLIVTVKPTPMKKKLVRIPLAPKVVISNSANTLITEVNDFRASQQKSHLVSSLTLCSIAEKRISELLRRGTLDNHEGFQAYVGTIKTSFNSWGETLFWASSTKSSHEIVFTHWANSNGHRATLLSEATHGCGATKNGFAVFIIGKKK